MAVLGCRCLRCSQLAAALAGSVCKKAAIHGLPPQKAVSAWTVNRLYKRTGRLTWQLHVACMIAMLGSGLAFLCQVGSRCDRNLAIILFYSVNLVLKTVHIEGSACVNTEGWRRGILTQLLYVLTSSSFSSRRCRSGGGHVTPAVPA